MSVVFKSIQNWPTFVGVAGYSIPNSDCHLGSGKKTWIPNLDVWFLKFWIWKYNLKASSKEWKYTEVHLSSSMVRKTQASKSQNNVHNLDTRGKLVT